MTINILVLTNWQCFLIPNLTDSTLQQVYCLLQQAHWDSKGISTVSGPSWSLYVFTQNHKTVQACSLSTFHNCSLTSVGRVLKRSSSTTRPVLFSCRHSPSSTGRHSKRFPLSSSCVNPVSSPNRDGRDCRQLFPKFKVRSFLHWKSSLGRLSIFILKWRQRDGER